MASRRQDREQSRIHIWTNGATPAADASADMPETARTLWPGRGSRPVDTKAVAVRGSPLKHRGDLFPTKLQALPIWLKRTVEAQRGAERIARNS
jgi:hypothetical protein